MAVINSGFTSIVDEMNLSLFRSAYSPVITEGRDIGGAVFDGQGRLIAQGKWDLAVFVGLLEFSVTAILERYAGEIEPGDVFIMNDPFTGGTHFNDVGVARPVFDDSGVAGFVAVCGHWPDVGGQEPGSFVANAREHFQEGLRLPPMKLYQAGKPNRAVFDTIASNMRIPRDRLGDLRAQSGATTIGETRLRELASRYGWAGVKEAMDATMAHSESLLRSKIALFPDGVYEGEDFVDMESLDRPNPKRVHVRLTVEGDGMTFDFSKSDSQSLSAANGTYSSTSSAVYVTVKSLFPEVPMNHGCFVPLKVVASPGTIVNAQPPRAISSMAATVYEKVIGSCLLALAEASPEKAVGCPYNLINLTIGGSQDGRDYVAYLYSEGGFGGRATKDGPAGLVSLYGGGAKITPVEVTERRYPIEFEEWSLWPDSGGPGKFRGGVGSRKTFRLTGGSARLSCLGDREKYPPFGVLGGKSASTQSLVFNEGGDGEKNISLRAVGYELAAGDRVTVVAAGGGGYGDPYSRDPEAVARDVVKGYVTPERAGRDYGVVVTAGGIIDDAATAELRLGGRDPE
jgi:N-methylhydantoinase B